MAPKRAFGGALRPFGGGFRGPNRERASVFSSAGRGRCRGFCGGAGAGPARSAARDRAVQVVLRWSPGHKKNGPRSVHFYFCYTTLLLYGLLLRDARPIHPAARQRLRTPGARLFCGRLPAACSPATACLPSISVCPSVGGHNRESLRHPEPQPLSRPPVGAQPPGRRNLSRPGSRPSAARNLPSLLLAPSAAGVTAPPRRYGRPPATGESPASSLRRASPARDSTAYRPAP